MNHNLRSVPKLHLVSSAGGWAAVKALRKGKIFQKGDERILGDGDCVQSIIEQAEENFE